MENEIKICSNHNYYQVPMIWTFVFPGAEYWCPFCGATEGMFGAGQDVANTPELQTRLEKYKDKSALYLENYYLAGEPREWKYKQKAEDIL